MCVCVLQHMCGRRTIDRTEPLLFATVLTNRPVRPSHGRKLIIQLLGRSVGVRNGVGIETRQGNGGTGLPGVYVTTDTHTHTHTQSRTPLAPFPSRKTYADPDAGMLSHWARLVYEQCTNPQNAGERKVSSSRGSTMPASLLFWCTMADPPFHRFRVSIRRSRRWWMAGTGQNGGIAGGAQLSLLRCTTTTRRTSSPPHQPVEQRKQIQVCGPMPTSFPTNKHTHTHMEHAAL